jgi:hypothetical protein
MAKRKLVLKSEKHKFEQSEIFNISSGSSFQQEGLIELKHDAFKCNSYIFPRGN